MAEQPIQKSEIIDSGAIESIIKDFDKLTSHLEKTDNALRDIAKSVGTISSTTDTKGISKLTEQTNVLESAYKSQHQTQVDLIKIKKQQQSAEQSLQRQREKGIDAMNREKEAQEKLNRPYNVASRELREMKNRYRDLAVQKSQGIKLTKDEAKEYRTLGRSIKDADANLKSIDKSVGDNFRNVGNYKSAISGLRGALGQLGLAFGGIAIAKQAGQVLVDFDEKVADIVKTTGLSVAQVKELSNELLKIDTRTSITSLQELASAAGRLGITGKDDILGFVRSSDQAFVALGDDLDGTAEEIATNLGKIAGIFGDESKFGIEKAIAKTGSVLNELSANSKASAGAIFDFTQRMAGVASQAGIAQTDIQALGALFDSTGQSIEVASSTLAKILPELSSNQKKYAQVAGMTAESFASMLKNNPIDALKAVAKGAKSSKGGLDGLVATLGDFGVDSARAAGIVGVLAGNTEELTRLQGIANTAFEEGTSLTNEFNVKNNTLGATMEKLSKEFQKYVLGIDEAGNVTGKFSSVLQFLVNNLPRIISLLGRLIALWVSYKVAMKAIEINKTIEDFGGLKNAIIDNEKTLKDGTKAANGFGSALKGIGFGIALQLFVELAMKFYDIASGAAAAREAMARFDLQVRKSSKAAGKKVNDLRETEKQLIAKYNEELKKRNITQEQYNELVTKAKSTTVAELKNNIKIANERKERYKYLKLELEKVNEAIGKNTHEAGLYAKQIKLVKKIGDELKIKGDVAYGFLETDATSAQVLAQLNANISGTNTRLKTYYGALKDIDDESKDFTVKTDENSNSVKGFGTNVNKTTETTTDYTKALRDLNVEMLKGTDEASTKHLQDTKKLANEYADAVEKIENDKATTKIKKDEYLIALHAKYIADSKKLDDDYLKASAKAIRDKIASDIELNRTAFDMSTGRTETEQRIAELRKYIDAKETINSNEKLSDEKRAKALEKIEKDHQKAMLKIQIDALQKRLDNELLLQEEIKNQLGVKSEEYKNSQDNVNSITEQLLTLNQELVNDAPTNEIGENFKKIADYFGKLLDAAQKKIDETFDKLIASQNKSIESSKNLVSNLQAAANAGNLQASKSILAEEKKQEEALKRIEKLQKRQQMTQMITGILGSYSAKVAAGEKNALLSTITDATVLSSFIKSLPTFDVGSDRLLSNGRSVDNKGGFLAINHPDERIMTAEQNKIIGFNHKNSDIAKVMSYYNKGLLKPISDVNPVIVKQNDNSELLRSINEGFSKINNYNMSFEQLFSTFSLIIEKRKNGDIFKTKKSFKI